jgi:hypothetical protein
MVRVLVTVEPRMYREAIALAVQSNRPKAEVMLVSEEVMDGQVKEFAPHVLVRNDSDRPIPEGQLERVMNSAGKPHRNANISVSSVLSRSPVFRISKPFLTKFITASSKRVIPLPLFTRVRGRGILRS